MLNSKKQDVGFRVSSKNIILLTLGLTLTLTACGTSSSSELRPRTVEENAAIQDSWFPVRNKECQLIVDSFTLVSAAVGGTDTQYLAENMSEIERNLKSAGAATSEALLRLSNSTDEPSIRSWTLRAVPIFAKLGMLTSATDDQSNDQILSFFSELSQLVEDVPSACKS